MSIFGNRALVIGAAGGMGQAIASALSAEGMSLVLAGRRVEPLESLATDLAKSGGSTVPMQLDIADPAMIGPSVERAADALGGLDIIVNCAGIHKTARAHEADLADWDLVLDTIFRGFVHLCRHALPFLNESGAGAIVTIGSVTSAYPGAGMHLGSRRALQGFCEALFEDVREFGTKVCVINPGYVNTPMVRSDRLDRSRMIQPEDIARTVLFVLGMPATACPTEITIRPQRTPYRSG